MIDVKKMYYQLPEEEFLKKLDLLRSSRATILVFPEDTHSFFYVQDDDMNQLIFQMHQLQAEFDEMILSFTPFARNQIIQSFLIDEINSTNIIEGIHSTRQDVFYILQKAGKSSDAQIRSTANMYEMLLKGGNSPIKTIADIRSVYDALMKDSFFSKDDIPDGEYFRKGSVQMSDGLKSIHSGFYPEERINQGMNSFLSLYNNSAIDIYLRLIISHFMLEVIHPYYDGNGRLGRLLFSKALFEQERTYYSFAISISVLNQKDKYDKAFKAAEDIHQYGCLNPYANQFLRILIDGITDIIASLNEKKKQMAALEKSVPQNWGNAKKSVYHCLIEAETFTFYGLTLQELMRQTDLSRRTVIYMLNELRSDNLIQETRIGRYIYRKASDII